jgi:hypothetical protein
MNYVAGGASDVLVGLTEEADPSTAGSVRLDRDTLVIDVPSSAPIRVQLSAIGSVEAIGLPANGCDLVEIRLASGEGRRFLWPEAFSADLVSALGALASAPRTLWPANDSGSISATPVGPSSPPVGAIGGLAGQLAALAGSYRAGLLSESEFGAAKSRLLSVGEPAVAGTGAQSPMRVALPTALLAGAIGWNVISYWTSDSTWAWFSLSVAAAMVALTIAAFLVPDTLRVAVAATPAALALGSTAAISLIDRVVGDYWYSSFETIAVPAAEIAAAVLLIASLWKRRPDMSGTFTIPPIGLVAGAVVGLSLLVAQLGPGQADDLDGWAVWTWLVVNVAFSGLAVVLVWAVKERYAPWLAWGAVLIVMTWAGGSIGEAIYDDAAWSAVWAVFGLVVAMAVAIWTSLPFVRARLNTSTQGV